MYKSIKFPNILKEVAKDGKFKRVAKCEYKGQKCYVAEVIFDYGDKYLIYIDKD